MLIAMVGLAMFAASMFGIFGKDLMSPVGQQDERTRIKANGEDQPVLRSDTRTVTYTTDGFTPTKLEIAKGTTVNFMNRTQLPMWVASEPHPSHTNYPQLDAGAMAGGHVSPGNPSFSFKFDKPGFWGYHNHAAPEHMALIIVK